MTNAESSDTAYLHASIGRFCIAFANLDIQIDCFAAQIIGCSPNTAVALMNSMKGTTDKCNSLKNVVVCEFCEEHWQSYLRDLLSFIIKLAEARNRIVHDRWWLSADAARKHRVLGKSRRSSGDGKHEFKSALFEDVPKTYILNLSKLVEDVHWHVVFAEVCIDDHKKNVGEPNLGAQVLELSCLIERFQAINDELV